MTRFLCLVIIGVFLFGCITPVTAGPGPIIIDQTCTDIHKIPDYWLERAKTITLHYAHTSHGHQLIDGAYAWEAFNPKYSLAVNVGTTEGLPSLENPPALRVYDGTLIDDYATPDMYWNGSSGIASTTTIADSGHYDLSMFAFCNEISLYTEAEVATYLNQMNTFEQQHPSMRFIYMTGHAVDGPNGGPTGNLAQRNQQIREYCIANNKVLYDFERIGSYDPDGTSYFSSNGIGGDNADECAYSGGNWCTAWVSTHPDRKSTRLNSSH